MKLTTAKQFHDKVTAMLRSNDVIAITRHGKIAGYFLPHRLKNLPADVRWKLFEEATARIRETLKKQGITEEEILEDFERWRKGHKTSRRRR